ncbi:tryptophan synthase subunit alpha [Paenibacillus yanchengensis]|uniref:Tryptophan synthase alpha chain n=1 Tax=Paenibacillus yanchengensis TaxID=2035833 RepID=A0ABW4YJY3_9BACL
MNLIDKVFAELQAKKETALIPFLTMGDPDKETTIDIIKEAEAAGAHIIELGVPYSDPLADGPVIQRASQRALIYNITLDDCMEIAQSARQQGVKLPFVLFTYFNPVLQYGVERLIEKAKEMDISGLLIPDLPIEENAVIRKLTEKHGIHLISLIAPTSADRIAKIASEAAGFIYCVSSLGVTGERADFHHEIDQFLSTVRKHANVPIAVGFGISSREQVERFEPLCDGVIIGSAIVRTIEENIPLLQSNEQRATGLNNIRQFIAQFKPE